ncbi:MAG: autotransporter-associated beta strand repeat-containing protein [Prolixibacteraceae bacterium]
MKLRKKINLIGLLIAFLLLSFIQVEAQRQMEKLDRGLIAVRSGLNNVFVSWRLFGDDPDVVAFNLYRDGTKLNTEPISGATNFTDATSGNGTYTLNPVLNGSEQAVAASCTVWSSNYKTVPLNKPGDGKTPSGESYYYRPNDCSVGDVDGDGQYEIILKWDPSNSKDNSQSGYTGNVYLDAYKLDGTFLWRIDLGVNIRAGAHYTQFMVYDLDGDGKAEVACKTAPRTKDATGNYLKMGPAANDNDLSDYRTTNGYILSGPEYLTVFNGQTGAEMSTVSYNPPRGSVSSWGDSYGNRVDRFLACVAYLDGRRPSLVMCRGYYTRTVLAAWDWRDGALTQRWVFDSNNPGYSGYEGQGNHNLTVTDVDDDGKDEIVYGACTIDDNGAGLYTTGLAHGDALHVSDLDPNRKGLETFSPHESGNNGVTFRDAKTGEILWQHKNSNDVGRGVAADITPEYEGMESWASNGLGVYNNKGEVISSNFPSMNFSIWWDGDLTRELLDNITITKFNVGTLFSATGCESNNGTKATPNLQADILGDWREEVILRTSDDNSLRIYTTTNSTNQRIYTLMHDPQYRLSIAWQNTGYNQPPQTGFYLANGMTTLPPSPMTGNKLIWKSGSNWDAGVSTNWTKNNSASVYSDGDDVLFDLSGDNSAPVQVSGNPGPNSFSVISPTDYTFNGSGNISGTTGLKKAGSGTLTLNTTNDYSGKTIVYDGILNVNGTLNNSEVNVKKFAELGGNGVLAKGANLDAKSILKVGQNGSADTLKIQDHLSLAGEVSLCFDLSDDPSGIAKRNDLLQLSGNLNLTGINSFKINLLNGQIIPGDYPLIKFSGTFTGNLEDQKVDGISGLGYKLKNSGNAIVLEILNLRANTSIIWNGGTLNTWDVANLKNWLNNGTSDWFVPNDSVIFDQTGSANNEINLEEEMQISGMRVDAQTDYLFGGSGSIAGPGGIVKKGSGKLFLNTKNKYDGATQILKGIVEVPEIGKSGQPGALGSSNADAANLVLNGGNLRVNNLESDTDRGINLGPNGGTLDIQASAGNLSVGGTITGNGTLEKTGNGNLTLTAANTYSGGTIISGGTISLGSDEANLSGLGTGPVTLKNGTLSMFDNSVSYTGNCDWGIIVPANYSGNLNLDSRCSLTGALEGEGTLNVYSPFIRSDLFGDWSQFSGKINVTTDGDGGTLILGNLNGYGKSAINLGNNVTALFRNTVSDTIEIGTLSGDAGSVLGAGGEGNTSITWKLGTNNSNSEFNGIINNTQYKNSGAKTAIIKAGSGTLSLTQGNSYSGNTRIEGGILLAGNTSGSATSSGFVTVAPGGTLGGKGYIDGAVTVNQGAVIAPGTDGTGYLTVNNNVTLNQGSYLAIDINTSEKISDMLIVSGKLILGGVLYISETGSGTLKDGDNFKIIDSPKCSGKFEEIIPSSPGIGLKWDTTGITVTGYISVALATGITKLTSNGDLKIFPNPATDKIAVSSGSSDLAGFGEELLIQCFDNQGRLIRGQSVSTATNLLNTEFDIQDLKPGIYQIIISGNQKTISGSFVRQRLH